MHVIRKEVIVERPIEEVFAFFDRPENLNKVTPPLLQFKILTPSPLAMHNGQVFDYTLKIMGIPFHWQTIITNYSPPHEFVDVQLKGPYQFWHHRHRFIPVENGTKVIDEVHYTLSPLTNWTHSFLVRPRLEKIFAYRDQLTVLLSPDHHQG